MGNTSKTIQKPAATPKMVGDAFGAMSADPTAPTMRITGPPISQADALAGIVVIPPEEGLDLGEEFDKWNAEDREGDPEEQQRSFDLLMRLLEEDHF